MKPGRSKDLVAAVALAGALGLGGFLFLRARGALGVSWTDGERTFRSETGEAVRHAVWDAPEDLGELGEIAHPTLSPDGRWLVFAAGERGLNCQLYLAELSGGVPRDPRPLDALETSADELAPAFGHGALYFASDRPGGAGKLDLWRAPYADGEFGAAEPLPGGLNSAADETDPAPVPGTRALVFASDRARTDHDLYAAVPDETGQFTCASLAALNSTAEEREPSFSDDPRSLVFASDRAGGAGAFDLYRALHFGAAVPEGWRSPGLVAELSTPRAERAPALTADGFELLFAQEDEQGTSLLRRARSLELLRVPSPPITLAQWLTLAGLLLLALLALLAKRWHALDILYKCLLVSLVVHLLLMLYFRTVEPEAKNYETGTEEGGPTFKVRLVPGEPSDGAGRGLTGPLAPERERFEPDLARAEAPERLALEAPLRGEEAAPARVDELARDESSPPSPDLQQPAEQPERHARNAPELALAGEASAPTARSASGTEPSQARFAPSASAPASPARDSELAAVPASSPDDGTPAPERVARATGSDEASDPDLRAPAAERPAAPLRPALAFDATSGLSTSAAPRSDERGTDAPARQTSSPSTALGARPAPTLAALEPAPAGGDELAAPSFQPSRPGPSATTEAPPALRAPVAERGEASPRASARFDAALGLDVASTPARSTPAAPERIAPSSSSPTAPEPAVPPALPLAAPAPREELPERAPPPRLAETPYQNRFGEQKLRALEDFGGTPETERAVAEGLAYLARIQGEDGEWGQRSDRSSKYLDVRIGKSALALLAFLGAGHVPGRASEHTGVAERAVAYLLAAQDPATGHFGRSCSYGHGIATYALAECYALNQDPALRAALERAVDEILRHQSQREDERFLGGWGYYFADGHVWNGDEWPRTSVTAWQVMALESARLGGLAVPDQAFEDARTFLVNTWDEERRAFRYDHDPERLGSGYPILPASTPAALFALSLLAVDPSARELAPARRYVLTRAPDGYRYTGDDDFVAHARGNLYFWYYATLAMFRVGGPEWERWNAALQQTLLPAQDEDGSWRPIDTYSEYAGDDDGERTYSTAMCVLSLEIYYRYFTPLLQVR